MPTERSVWMNDLYINAQAIQMFSCENWGAWDIQAFFISAYVFIMVQKYGNPINYGLKYTNNSTAGPNINNKSYFMYKWLKHMRKTLIPGFHLSLQGSDDKSYRMPGLQSFFKHKVLRPGLWVWELNADQHEHTHTPYTNKQREWTWANYWLSSWK